MFNEISTPLGKHFHGWVELQGHENDSDIQYGYFYMGIIDGIGYWLYKDEQGEIHRCKHEGPFYLYDQIRTHHRGPFSFV